MIGQLCINGRNDVLCMHDEPPFLFRGILTGSDKKPSQIGISVDIVYVLDLFIIQTKTLNGLVLSVLMT